MITRNKKFALRILAFLFIADILAFIAVFDLKQPGFLEINFFDVGQGDAALIETPAGHQILIDGGPDSRILEKLGKTLPFWDRTIDLVILTHPEKDHLFGLLEVLKKYKVENILWTGVKRDTAEFEKWIELIAEERAKILIAKSGQKITMAELNNDILYPLESLEGQEFKDNNNTSIVAKFVFGKNSFLFTGDIYKSAERELLNLVKQQLRANILKVSHHGSKTSSDEEFIKEVSPEVAIISAGRENQYGHPHLETLETLKKYGIRTLSTPSSKTLNTSYLTILRTDVHGDIKIISDGNYYNVSNLQD